MTEDHVYYLHIKTQVYSNSHILEDFEASLKSLHLEKRGNTEFKVNSETVMPLTRVASFQMTEISVTIQSPVGNMVYGFNGYLWDIRSVEWLGEAPTDALLTTIMQKIRDAIALGKEYYITKLKSEVLK